MTCRKSLRGPRIWNSRLSMHNRSGTNSACCCGGTSSRTGGILLTTGRASSSHWSWLFSLARFSGRLETTGKICQSQPKNSLIQVKKIEINGLSGSVDKVSVCIIYCRLNLNFDEIQRIKSSCPGDLIQSSWVLLHRGGALTLSPFAGRTSRMCTTSWGRCTWLFSFLPSSMP